jgi:prepilin-type N-terminal cleavage/methylation domain-containing protein
MKTLRIVRRRHSRGFTLIELMITMTILLLAMVAVLELFDSTNHLSSVQTDLSNMQQSLRVGQQEIGRLLRMNGRGGISVAPALNQSALPLAQVRGIHQGPAIEVRNNVVTANRRIDLGGTSAPPIEAVLGTDILTLRGVFSTPIYWISIDPLKATGSTVTPFDPVNRIIQIDNDSSPTGRPQDFSAILAAPAGEALLMVSTLDPESFGVARLVSAAMVGNVLRVTYENGTVIGDSAESQLMARLSSGGAFPTLTRITSVGILEEWRYFVKQASDNDNLPNPIFTKARMKPGTEVPYNNQVANLNIELADDVHDFQIALGFDSCFPGSCSGGAANFLYFDADIDNTGNDDVIFENDSGSDDWLFNFANAPNGENPGNEPWSSPTATRIWNRQTRIPSPLPGAGWHPQPRLKFIRMSTLALSNRVDSTDYQGPQIDRIEDHVYSPTTDFANTFVGRRHRRQILQTVVDLRNAQ